ncbi:hypothetical protein [Chishuiella sp.]|uniref:hypothetical protein n=1 Tax=Chishuiella sp. TaxID=1969467 RepID=UPI0028B20609|nr:hypothetical protein [Chishuiella sp.]
MTYTTIIGFLLLAISAVIFYFTNLDFSGLFFDKEFLVGITGGTGIGFILGGFLGWLYKVKAVKAENNKIVEEQKQKIAEQKAQELFAKEQALNREDSSGL